MTLWDVTQRSMLGQMYFKGWAVILIPYRLSMVHDKTIRKKPLHVLGWDKGVSSADIIH